MAYVRIAISDYEKIKKQMDGLKNAPAKVMKNLTSDAKTRVPGWVATEVTKVYGIKKSEITGKKVGSMRVVGNGFKDLKFIYAGRLLTTTHFGMTPKAPKPGGGYTLKYRVLNKTQSKVKKLTKKQRKELAKNFSRQGPHTSDHSPIMLMHTGNARIDGTNYIPFQRKSKDRNDIQAIKTVSLPQMVSNRSVQLQIQEAINDGLGKRLEHYLNRNMPK